MRLDRADRASQHVRGFLVRQVVMVALDDRRPLAVGQHGHRALEVELERAAPGVIGVRVVDVRHGVAVLVSHVVRAVAQQLLLALARVGEPAVGRDPVQPGREPRFLPEGLQVAPREHERLLREIVRQRVVAGGQLAQAARAPSTGAASRARRTRDGRPRRARAR